MSALFAPCAPAEGCSARARPDAEQSAIIEAGRKPTAVPELRGALEISTADDFVCGRMTSGEIVCTGDDALGVLGDGKREKRTRTVRVPGIVGAQRISVSRWAACAVDDTGRVLCWGSGPVVGPDSSGTPRVIEGVAGAVDISVSTLTACAATKQGEILCWGDGKGGQTGHGATPQTAAQKVDW